MDGIYYFATKEDADNINFYAELGYTNTYKVGNGINCTCIIKWNIATDSTGSTTGVANNGDTLDSSGVYYLYPFPIIPVYPIPPYSHLSVEPPYNATDFTPANSQVYSTILTNAANSPNYPWNTGSNAQQIYRSKQNVSYYSNINQQTVANVKSNQISGGWQQKSYPQFKSQAERLMYIQGQTLNAARIAVTGQNPLPPQGLPPSTIYNIIASGNVPT